jgi:hypothetical protein
VRVCEKCHMKLQKNDSKSPKVASGSKLVVLGSTGTGKVAVSLLSHIKTALINRFIMNSYLEEGIPTVG